MLEIRHVNFSYGGHRALNDVSIEVAPGETVTILGANGAGKTTLLNVVGGLLRPEDGASLQCGGVDLLRLPPHRIVEHGIALVPEGRRLFGDLTVADNLRLGGFARRARDGAEETLEAVYELFPRLAERKEQRARTMSGGEQQMLAIGRALMTKPDYLLLDEPSLGLSPLLTKEVFRILEQVARSGVSILLVEQNARRSLEIADRAYVLEGGRIALAGEAERLLADELVQQTYLGGGPTLGTESSTA